MLAVLTLQSYSWLAVLITGLTLAALALLCALLNARSASASARSEGMRLQALLDATGETARQEMREAAKDLHESVGQLLSAAQLKLRGALDASPDDRLQATTEVIDQAIAELRTTTVALRAGLGSDLPLSERIALDADRLRRVSRIGVTLKELGLPPTLSEDERVILYNSCQQLISLALKRARTAQLDITVDAEGPLQLRVESDGQSTDAEALREAEALHAVSRRCGVIGFTARMDSNGTAWILTPKEA
ncbi:MAG: hypothetical protein IPK70_02015 [Flavobacteriales bacterium]|jgi:signal transduction histidine kinase|nr:hypothetical protein [Flavobacteriales bacterium]